MKRNSKKLVVFLIIAATTLFSVTAMAWDGDHDWNKTIEGKYAFAGVDFCFFAPGGFTDQFLLSLAPYGLGGLWQASTGTWEGFYVFHHDGTGEYKAKGGHFSVPGPATPTPFVAGVGNSNLDFKFRYTVRKGKIKFTYELGSWVQTNVYDPTMPGETLYVKITEPWYGRISPDGNNLIVTYGIPNKFIPTMDKDNEIPFPEDMYLEIVCNTVDQGFRVEEYSPFE